MEMPTASTYGKQHETPMNLGDKGETSNLLGDRISQLPDAILVDIISPLRIKEALRTSVLSKRWRYLWTHVTCLNFDDAKPPTSPSTAIKLLERTQRRRFRVYEEFKTRQRQTLPLTVVSEVLQSHEGRSVDGVKICGSYYSSDNVKNLIELAIRKRVQRIEVDTSRDEDTKWEKPFNNPFGVSCIKSLRHLSLKYVSISAEIVGQVLSDCQLLEHLSIYGSSDLYHVKAVGSSLRLKFLQLSFCVSLISVVIYAPNLVSFIYDGPRTYGTGIVLKHAPKLVHVSLSEEDNAAAVMLDLLSISSQFSYLQTLNLCMDHLRMRNIMLPEFTSLKDLSLTIRVRNDEQRLQDLTSLLTKSPFLHRLTLKLQWESVHERYTRNVQEIKGCPHQCLKVVKFSGFIGMGGSIIDTEFAMCLIENALVLEKFIIDLEKFELGLPPYILPEFVTTEKKLEAMKEHAL